MSMATVSLLSPVGPRPLSQPPAWNSDIADDRTPAEFSVAFDDDGSTTVRVLIEPVAAQPGHRANMELSTRLVHSLSERFGFSLDQFHAISELFLPAEPRGSSRSGVRLCCGRRAHRISISGYRLVEIPTLLRPFNCRLVPLAVE